MSESTAVARIEFHGDEIHSVMVGDKPHIAARPIIESLGLDWSAQYRRLQRSSWASVVVMATQLPGDTQARQTVMVSLRTLLMLLATVDETRVAEDVRPKLAAYQSEVADVIEAYWTRGGAINPRADETELADLAEDIEARRKHLAAIRTAERIEAQVRVLNAMTGLVDPQWLAAQAQERYAVATGRELETVHEERTLTVGEFLAEKNLPAAAVRSMSGTFGKAMKQAFRQAHGAEPGKSLRFVDGAQREVAAYREEHRPLMEQVWRDVNR